MRELERRVLERTGHHVHEAAGAAAAFAWLADGKRVDLLIADIDMPDLGGVERVRHIRTSRPDLKVLYVSGNVDRLMDVSSTPGEAFLDKPFTAKRLIEAVSRLLSGPS